MSTSEAEPAAAGIERRRQPARAENIGSLLRPKRLLEAMEKVYEPGHTALLAEERQKDLTELRAVEDELIRDTVSRQINAGLDIVTDGEFRRGLFVNSFYDAVEGLQASTEPVPFHNAKGETLYYPGPAIINRRLRKVGSPAVDETEFLKSTTQHPFKITFPAGSWFRMPFLWKPGVTDRDYQDEDALVEHVQGIHRDLVADAVAAGARYIQFDYPSYVFLLDEDWLELIRSMDKDPAILFDKMIEADQEIIRDMPADVKVLLHLCRGNHQSSWMTTGSLEPVAERMFNELPYHAFHIEWEDIEREGDYSALRYVPKGPIIGLGIVSTKNPVIEEEDELMRRFEEASAYLDVSQLAVSTQCGFASTAPGNVLDEETQWRKLELVGRVADRIWGTSS
ncbi:MAG: hypothetical protein GEV09_16700 [Pseudonocardiaceae bacterium]|nr:hypothetical protein [Pseudonocardiaceae bacterium]